VVHWIEAEVGAADGLFDCPQLGRIERLYRDHLRLWCMNLGHLVERHLLSVVVDQNGVEHVNIRSPGARGGHFAAEIFHRFVHPRLELCEDVFQGRMSHSLGLLGYMRIKTVNYKPKTDPPTR